MKTESKIAHTPGPWEYAYGAVYDKQGVPIGKADRDTPLTQPVERDANARLMAAAPELLSVLQDELEAIDTWLRDDSLSDDVKVGMLISEDKIQRVIRKAKGEL